MNPVFKKLQFRDQDPIYVGNAPAAFQPHLEEMVELTRVVTRAAGRQRFGLVLCFVENCAETWTTSSPCRATPSGP